MCDGGACLEGQNRGNRPPANDRVQSPIHVVANPQAAANWNVHDGGQNHALGGIVGADGTLRLQVVQFLWVTVGQRSVINEFAPADESSIALAQV